jgi:hypothetical protein
MRIVSVEERRAGLFGVLRGCALRFQRGDAALQFGVPGAQYGDLLLQGEQMRL